MNDLFFVRYEARRMLVDSMDMPPDVELAHRRLCDFVWAMDGPPDDDVTILVSITRSTPNDWVRVRGGLERKGWHQEGGKFTHNGAVKTLILGKEIHTSAIERTKAATEARLSKRNVERDDIRDVKRNEMQSESELESEGTEGRKEGKSPSLEEVKTRASITGMPEEDAIAFWNHFESTGWIDKNGHPIKKWKSKMDNWKCQSRSKPNESGKRAVSGNGTADKILLSKELDRVELKIKEIRDNSVQDAWGPMLDDVSKSKISDLKKRRDEIKSALGFHA